MSTATTLIPAPSPPPANHASPSSHSPNSFLHLLRVCRRTSDFSQAHATFTKLGLSLNPNPSAYNSIIHGYTTSGRPDLALSLFRHLLLAGFPSPNSMTFPSILKACSFLSASTEARQIHGQILKRNLQTDPYTQNALIHVYAQIGSLSDAFLVFERMSQREVVSWNIVVAALVDAGFVGDARKVFDNMPERDVIFVFLCDDCHIANCKPFPSHKKYYYYFMSFACFFSIRLFWLVRSLWYRYLCTFFLPFSLWKAGKKICV